MSFISIEAKSEMGRAGALPDQAPPGSASEACCRVLFLVGVWKTKPAPKLGSMKKEACSQGHGPSNLYFCTRVAGELRMGRKRTCHPICPQSTWPGTLGLGSEVPPGAHVDPAARQSLRAFWTLSLQAQGLGHHSERPPPNSRP